MTNSKKFFVDFLNKKICATKTTFKQTGKGYGDAYEELCAIVKKHPDFELAEKEQQKHTTRAKETYGGCSLDFIYDYVKMKNNPELTQEMKNIIAFCEKTGETSLPKLKSWMIKKFKNDFEDERFNMTEAKEQVRVWKLANAAAKGAAAASNAALTKAA